MARAKDKKEYDRKKRSQKYEFDAIEAGDVPASNARSQEQASRVRQNLLLQFEAEDRVAPKKKTIKRTPRKGKPPSKAPMEVIKRAQKKKQKSL